MVFQYQYQYIFNINKSSGWNTTSPSFTRASILDYVLKTWAFMVWCSAKKQHLKESDESQLLNIEVHHT